MDSTVTVLSLVLEIIELDTVVFEVVQVLARDRVGVSDNLEM